MATGATYFLGIDVGTTRIAAATARTAPDGSIVAAPFPLGRRNDSAATVVFVADDGELLIGDAAERRGITQPDRLVREFKRSIGDDVPVVAGGRSIPAEKLWAHTVSAVVDAVVEREGSRPAAVMLTHPTAWGPHRIGLILSALDKLGVKDVHLITEPEAAARHYESGRTMEPGQALAVYDLGGGTFDSVVLRKSADGSFAPVGIPVGIDNLGGADFDDAVFRHVLRSSGVAETDLDDTDPDIRLALAQLRRECVEAKEALSFDSDVTVPVLLPSGATSVRLTRQEFEEMIAGSIERTIDTLEDGLDSAGLEPDALESILLIGGSSRIPLVAERLSERLDRPIAIDADPKSSIALGAARALVPVTADESVATLALVPVGAAAAGALATTDAAAAATTDLAVFDPAGPAERKAARRWYQRVPAVAAAGAGALVIATGLVFASAGGLGAGTFDAAASTENLREWVDVELTPSPAAADELQTSDPIAAAQQPAAPQARQDRSSTENKPKATNARKQAAERNAAVRPPEQPKPAASQSATSGKPSSSQPTQPSGGGTGSNTPAPGTSTPAPGTSTPAPDPTTTTPAPDPTTTTPAPDPTTTTPAPDPTTTTPAPDPTTTTPAPDPTTTTPAPDPTTPASEPPASEPPADTTPAP